MKTIILTLSILSNVCYINAQNYEHIISNNKVFSIASFDDYLWLGTNGGIVKFNKKTEEFIQYTKINDPSIQGYLGHTFISLVINNKGELYSTGEGFICFDGSNWKSLTNQNSNLPRNETQYVGLDNNNNLWVSSGEFMCTLENNEWKNHELMDASLLAYFSVYECDFDSENNAWVGTSRGLFKIENESVKSIDDFYFGKTNSVKVKNDTIIAGTSSKGLVLYTPSDSNIVIYNTENSNITNNYVQYVYPVEDSCWVIAADKLLLFNDRQFTVYMDKDSVLNNLILNRVLPDGDILWLATASDGLYKYNLTTNTCEKKIISNNPLKSSFNTFYVDTLGCMYFMDSNDPDTLKIKDKGYWTIKSKDELDYFNQTFNKKYTTDTMLLYEKNDVAIWIQEDFLGIYNNNPKISGPVKLRNNNSVYYISSSGGYRVYDGNWTKFSNDNTIIPTKYLSNLCFDNSGKLWLSANPGLDNDTQEIIPGGLLSYHENELEVIPQYDIPGVDGGSIISCIYIDNNDVLWIGISDLSVRGVYFGYGLFKYDGDTWVNYTIENSGLSSNSIVCINSFEDELYIGTDGGGISVFNTSTNDWKNYNSENSALPWNHINSIHFDSDGNMYTHVNLNGVLKTNRNLDFLQTGIETSPVEDKIIVFPNPTDDWITIKIPDASPTTIKKICVYDISGKLMISKNISTINSNETRINLKEELQKDGIYFIEIITDKRAYVNKIILYH